MLVTLWSILTLVQAGGVRERIVSDASDRQANILLGMVTAPPGPVYP